MKTLSAPQITVSGDTITIVAKVVDQPFNGMLITRTSHDIFHPETQHPRRIIASNEAVFIEAPGGKFVIPNDVLALIAAGAAPETSFAPKFKSCSAPGCVDCVSENPVSYQWQVSNNAFPESDKPHTPPPPAVWADIPGETGATLDESLVSIGQWIRCVASNATGKTITRPAQKK